MTPGDTVGRTPIKTTKSVSCTWCSLEITCWSRELARKIVGSHQQRRHIKDNNKHMGQETHMTLKDTSVKESHSRGTSGKKENDRKDLSLLEVTDTTKGHDILTSTFYLGRVEPTPEETESRNNLGVLMDSVRNRY